jgi:hypothetical protein
MELEFPDIPEYHFILKGLCSDKFPAYPRFQCEAVTAFEDELTADVAFVPAPIAVLNSHGYIFLRSGSVFSHFSGPQIFASQEKNDELFVSEKDLVSEYYAKILLDEVAIKKGEGFPTIVEPRIAMLGGQSGSTKFDLYSKWAEFADKLPFPLYSGIIKRSAKDLKVLIEEAVNASVKYALDNASEVTRDIATMFSVENYEMLKRVMFQFVNKDTISISEDEVKSLMALKERMEKKGYAVSDLKF